MLLELSIQKGWQFVKDICDFRFAILDFWFIILQWVVAV
jgi:hypothetical protein